MTNYLKETAVLLASTMLIEIPFNSIYSYADNLFDLPEMKLGDLKLDEQIKFLQATTLAQVEYDNLDDEALFTINNKHNGSSIKLSNRGSSRNEIRGEVLRSIIRNEKKSNPNQTLYDLISTAVKSPKYSDSIVMMRGSLVGKTAMMTVKKSMTNEHFDLFVNMILGSINKKIKTRVISPLINPLDIRRNEDIRTNIIKDIHFENGFELTRTLTEHNSFHELSFSILQNLIFLQTHQQLLPSLMNLNIKMSELKDKAKNLRLENYLVESNQVYALVQNLNIEQERFIAGKLTKDEFIKNTKELVTEAKHSKLSNMRGLGKILFGILNVLISIATFGVANVITGRFFIFYKQTNTISKVNFVDKALVDISEFDNNQKYELLD